MLVIVLLFVLQLNLKLHQMVSPNMSQVLPSLLIKMSSNLLMFSQLRMSSINQIPNHLLVDSTTNHQPLCHFMEHILLSLTLSVPKPSEQVPSVKSSHLVVLHQVQLTLLSYLLVRSLPLVLQLPWLQTLLLTSTSKLLECPHGHVLLVKF